VVDTSGEQSVDSGKGKGVTPPAECKFFAKGSCKLGEECTFVHPPPPEDANSKGKSGNGRVRIRRGGKGKNQGNDAAPAYPTEGNFACAAVSAECWVESTVKAVRFDVNAEVFEFPASGPLMKYGEWPHVVGYRHAVRPLADN